MSKLLAWLKAWWSRRSSDVEYVYVEHDGDRSREWVAPSPDELVTLVKKFRLLDAEAFGLGGDR